VYLSRAIDQVGQVIDVLVSEKRISRLPRRFFAHALDPYPSEVIIDRAPAYPRVLDELLPAACHVVEQYASNPVEADHGRFKARLRPMRGLKRLGSTRVISAGHAFIQKALLRCAKLGQAGSLIQVGQIARVSSSKAARTRRLTGSSVPSS
jgi:transposase, IS6 family